MVLSLRQVILLVVVHCLGVSGSHTKGADCNDNGIEDVQETLEDPSIDCNQNAVPDDCDVRTVNPSFSFTAEIVIVPSSEVSMSPVLPGCTHTRSSPSSHSSSQISASATCPSTESVPDEARRSPERKLL